MRTWTSRSRDPRPASREGLVEHSNLAIRWSVSSLIIAFPVFLYVSRLLAGAMRRDPAQRASRVRKWLTCLTQEQGIGVASLDPETGRPYGYRILGGNSYELCAEFTRDAAEEGRMPEGDFWTHAAGTQCFRLEASDVEP